MLLLSGEVQWGEPDVVGLARICSVGQQASHLVGVAVRGCVVDRGAPELVVLAEYIDHTVILL
jgi:hypothetical protein